MISKFVYLLIPTALASVTVVAFKYHKTPESIQNLKYLTENLQQVSTSATEIIPQSCPPPTPEIPKFEMVEPEPIAPVKQSESTSSSEINFCGEAIPMEEALVANKFQETLSRYKAAAGSLQYSSKVGSRYKNEIMKILKDNGLHEDFYYLAIAESGLNNLTSPKGAKGFWQFMEDAAKRNGLEISETVDERLHPQKATLAACKYLKTMHKMFHNWTLSAAAYNMGAGGLSSQIQAQGTKNYFHLSLNSETANYVYRILAIKYLMEHPSKYGIKLNGKSNYAPIPYYILKVNQSLPDLAAFAEQQGVSLGVLKTLNPWLISDKLVVNQGKTYEIRLPKSEKFSAEELIALPYHAAADRKKTRDSIVKSFSKTRTKSL